MNTLGFTRFNDMQTRGDESTFSLFRELPKDLYIDILCFLEPQEVISTKKLNRQIYQIVDSFLPSTPAWDCMLLNRCLRFAKPQYQMMVSEATRLNDVRETARMNPHPMEIELQQREDRMADLHSALSHLESMEKRNVDLELIYSGTINLMQQYQIDHFLTVTRGGLVTIWDGQTQFNPPQPLFHAYVLKQQHDQDLLHKMNKRCTTISSVKQTGNYLAIKLKVSMEEAEKNEQGWNKKLKDHTFVIYRDLNRFINTDFENPFAQGPFFEEESKLINADNVFLLIYPYKIVAYKLDKGIQKCIWIYRTKAYASEERIHRDFTQDCICSNEVLLNKNIVVVPMATNNFVCYSENNNFPAGLAFAIEILDIRTGLILQSRFVKKPWNDKLSMPSILKIMTNGDFVAYQDYKDSQSKLTILHKGGSQFSKLPVRGKVFDFKIDFEGSEDKRSVKVQASYIRGRDVQKITLQSIGLLPVSRSEKFKVRLKKIFHCSCLGFNHR